MAHFDLGLDELRSYRPQVDRPDDFDEFWSGQLTAAAEHDLAVTCERVESRIQSADVYDVWFSGHGGTRVAAWLLVPRDIDERAPVVIEFVGYNGGRGRPLDWLDWMSIGYAHLVVDARGQGGGWRTADTHDAGNPGEPGSRSHLTSGLSSPDRHYYARLFTDAGRAMQVPGALDVLRGRPIVTAGASQGGALALAAASLGGHAELVLPEVPFLAHFRRAVALTDEEPYSELARYCRVYPDRVDTVFRTLSYFDVVNHAGRIVAPALFSVGLTDLITPPSTVFAAYHAYAGPKEIEVYEFNGHEGGGTLHFERQVAFVDAHVGRGE